MNWLVSPFRFHFSTHFVPLILSFLFLSALFVCVLCVSLPPFAAVTEAVEFCLSSQQSCHINKLYTHHTTLLRGETAESRSWKVLNASRTRIAWRKSRCRNDKLTLSRSPRCACGRCSRATSSSTRSSTKFATAEASGISSPTCCM